MAVIHDISIVFILIMIFLAIWWIVVHWIFRRKEYPIEEISEVFQNAAELIRSRMNSTFELQEYESKPVVIQACQLTEGNLASAVAHIIRKGHEAHLRNETEDRYIIIETLEGNHNARPGDWIICGLIGEFYPCVDEVFQQKYALVE